MVTDICLKYILSYRVYTSLSWLHYYSMLALHDRPVLEMVSLLFLELYQLFQYSYDCSCDVCPSGGWGLRAGH